MSKTMNFYRKRLRKVRKETKTLFFLFVFTAIFIYLLGIVLTVTTWLTWSVILNVVMLFLITHYIRSTKLEILMAMKSVKVVMRKKSLVSVYLITQEG